MGENVPVEWEAAADKYLEETWLQNPASDGIIYGASDMKDAFYAGVEWAIFNVET